MVSKTERIDEDDFLREATLEDMKLVFNWANDREVRENAFSSNLITWEEHVKWYREMLEREDIKLYIFVSSGNEVGQVRINIYGEKAEITYSISKEYRCMGNAKKMLFLLYEKVKMEFSFIKKLVARVKPYNIASKKAFLKNGYVEVYDVYELDMEQILKDEMLVSNKCLGDNFLNE